MEECRKNIQHPGKNARKAHKTHGRTQAEHTKPMAECKKNTQNLWTNARRTHKAHGRTEEDMWPQGIP